MELLTINHPPRGIKGTECLTRATVHSSDAYLFKPMSANDGWSIVYCWMCIGRTRGTSKDGVRLNLVQLDCDQRVA